MCVGSDHKVVTATFRLSLRKSKLKPIARRKFNTELLLDKNKRHDFNLELSNKFATLYDETLSLSPTEEIQRHANVLNEALVGTCETILGKRTNSKQPSWVSTNTLLLIKNKDEAKIKHRQQRTKDSKSEWIEAHKKASTALEADKSENLESQLIELEYAASKREHGNVWRIIKRLSGQQKKPIRVRKSDGTLPKSKEETLAEWHNYFLDLLNNQSPWVNRANHPAPMPDLPSIKTSAFTITEINEAIKRLKRNKAPGPDYAMTAEVIKDGGPFLVNSLLKLCQMVYENCQAPSQWTSSLIIPLPKKGNLELMTNYRGISLMSIAAKLYNSILLNRIRVPIDKLLRNNQAGFRIGRSCNQQIHILRRIIEGANHEDIPLYITFVDFKKAFDSIDREMMFAILRHYGIPAKIVNAIRVLYDNSESQVYEGGQLSMPFKITTGVLQGDVLAPFLFIVVIDYITRRSQDQFGYVTHTGKKNESGYSLRAKTYAKERKVSDLDFADDIALLENCPLKAQNQLDALRNSARTTGLEINIAKTEQMRLNLPANQPSPPNLTIDGQGIAVVDDFKYLGSYVGSSEKDISIRLGLAWGAFNKLRSLLTSKTLSNQLKLRLFNAACVSVLLYGCECWLLNASSTKKLDVFARTCYRLILNIDQSEDHISNDQLYKLVDQPAISDTIRKRQLQYVGHCLRMDPEEPANIYSLYLSKMKESGQIGRPKHTYYEQIARHLCSDKEIKPSLDQIKVWAKDKRSWNKLLVVPKKPAR